MKDFVQSGTFNMEGSTPTIQPGQSISVRFYAGKGQALMFASMYGYSNDLFFAPENPGIALFNSDGTAITGDVSSKIRLWDNGTRVNEQPSAENTHPGVAEAGMIKMINREDAQGNLYRDAWELMKLELSYDQPTSMFTLKITNISGGTINETPFSPGVWAVSNVLSGELVNKAPFFEVDKKSSAQLTGLAEMGNNVPLGEMIDGMTGIITTISPVVVVVYTGDVNPIYELNKKDAGIGLKALAQKGETGALKDALKGMGNVRDVFVAGNNPAPPTGKLEVEFKAYKNDKIAFATMFAYSNDWFFSNSSAIDAMAKGNITDKVVLLDNGTGVNQYPGAGNMQALFGGTPQAEDNPITVVGNTYPVPTVSKLINVTIR